MSSVSPVPPTAASEPARRGRPRSAAADAAILGATRAMLAESGWAGLTVEGVAARAGVAKTTVYRRFSSRSDLAVAAVAELLASARIEPGGDAASDIAGAVRACAEVYATPEARAAYLAVVAEAGRDDELRHAVERSIIEPARRLVSDGLDRAVARGEISRARADERCDLLYDVLAGTLLHRLLVRGDDIDEAFVQTLTSAVLVALRHDAVAGPS
ncbi:MAG TPA: TetR/AcrR family transcriptional regulator [Candidatus Nanopelagicales bacterium]|nr:TetR/AcrR family transcriptional regulator [Candidatus Nanopelagicales bacterium]